MLPYNVKTKPPEVGLSDKTGATLVIAGALYVSKLVPSSELEAPPPGTSTLSSLVPTPLGNTHVIALNPLTLTPLQDFDVDKIFDVTVTIVLTDEVP